MRFTLNDIERLKAEGKIRGFTEKKIKPAGKIVTKAFKKRSKEKEWMEAALLEFCQLRSLQLISEHKFHPVKKWRFDWAIPEKKWAFEYEGVFNGKSRHTNVLGFTEDTNKYREAVKLDWKVLRYTARNYKELINDLNALI